MFGQGAKTADQSAASIQPGITSGFTVSEFFVPQAGDNWKAWDFIFDGPITVKDRLFLPKKKTQAQDYDAGNLVKFNERRVKRNQSEMSMTEYLQHQWEQDLQNFDKQIRMYIFSFYGDGSDERAAADAKLPKIETAEAFVSGIDDYITTLKTLLPENYVGTPFDIILGKKPSGRYLEFPAIWVTGRYVKVSADTTRELKLSDRFKTKYMGGANPSTATAAPQPAENVSWNANTAA